MEFYFVLICMGAFVRLLTQDLPDTDNIVPFENTTPINQNKNGKIKERRAD